MSVSRKLADLYERAESKTREARLRATRIINAVGEIRSAETLRDASLDDLLEDVSRLCTLKVEVTALLRDQRELGSV